MSDLVSDRSKDVFEMTLIRERITPQIDPELPAESGRYANQAPDNDPLPEKPSSVPPTLTGQGDVTQDGTQPVV